VTDTQPPTQPASHVAVAITLNAKASSLKILRIGLKSLKQLCNFDKTLRFFPSDGSIFGFFSTGVMNAALKCDGPG